MNCVTTTEALAVSLVGATAAADELRRVVRDALRGRSAHERRLETWEANAAFIASLDLDPDEVLGLPPAPAVERPRSARSLRAPLPTLARRAWA